MRISISADGWAVVDGDARFVGLALPDGTRAMHWDGEAGFAETTTGLVTIGLDDFDAWLSAHAQASGHAPGRWKVLRSTMVDRMSDPEAGGLEALLAALPAKQRLRWQAVRWVWNDDADVLAAAAALGWGQTRVDVILAYDADAAGVT